MAQQNAKELVIARGNADGPPETFSFVCGLRTRSHSMANAQIDTTVPNCTDPTQPIIATARPGRQTIQFSGDGLFDSDVVGKAVADDARTQKIDTNYQVTVPGYGSWTGPMFVADFEWSGDAEDPLAFSCTFVPLDNSQLVFAPAA